MPCVRPVRNVHWFSSAFRVGRQEGKKDPHHLFWVKLHIVEGSRARSRVQLKGSDLSIEQTLENATQTPMDSSIAESHTTGCS